MTTDLTFFTNEPGQALLDRFKATLKYVQFFDMLVGYFRSSGFYLLYQDFEAIEKIRILVGLNIDSQSFQIIQATQGQLELTSYQNSQKTFTKNLMTEMEEAPDTYHTELGVKKFIQFLQSGKIEIRASLQNIHAKVYISRFFEEDRDYGRVITGSSNFSQSGLQGNYEFNVELKQTTDVTYALEKFESIWASAVDLSPIYVDTIHKKTWLNNNISPYQLYLKFLYEYFKEDINLDQDDEFDPPPGFLDLSYQKQAVSAAKRILQSYNGVFLADVVGLGKTFIAAMLAKQLPGKKLVICPPVLKDYWYDTFYKFNVSVIVESLGKLEHIINNNPDRFDYIFVDEAHRFRNEVTQGYEMLHRICWGKKVILVSATPLNNSIEDIYSQLKLFQAPKKSLIPALPNLDDYFAQHRKTLKSFNKKTPEYAIALKEVAQDIRDKVLKYVMVRRTRKEIINHFSQDITQRGLFFPELADPERIIYTFNPATDTIFNQTIHHLQRLTYARYKPLLYLKQPLSHFEQQSQHNISGFMKGILVKRLESSFFAFKKSLQRFIESYQRFIDMLNQGTIYIGKDINIYDLLDADDEETLLNLIEADKVQAYPVTHFSPTLSTDLHHDLTLLKQIQQLWQSLNHAQDPKLQAFSQQLQHHPHLKNKKIVVFTESSETGAYLQQALNHLFPNQVLFYYSGGGLYKNQRHLNNRTAQSLIQSNYDPNYTDSPTPEDNLKILISTDVLAEGINLHQANIVINYDLPWNPTRVLQRVGRVNRVGSQHPLIYIFNFFPTAQSDEHLDLESNIKAKIQAFHDMLGEDAKYLTEEEDIDQFQLFGERHYYRLNNKQTFQDEGEGERSELAYLQLIRNIRDKDPALFQKIKRLPPKARTGRSLSHLPPPIHTPYLVFLDKVT